MRAALLTCFALLVPAVAQAVHLRVYPAFAEVR